MNTSGGSANCNWREDLENSRDLNLKEIAYIGFAFNWFESWSRKTALLHAIKIIE